MKILHKTLLAVAITASTFNLNAQGIWTANGTETDLTPTTTMVGGISSLTVRHSDAANVNGKTDATFTADGPFQNYGYLQGSTNSMFYAFKSIKDGTLSIATKLPKNMPVYVYEATGATINTVAASGNLINNVANNGAPTVSLSIGGTLSNGGYWGVNVTTTLSFPVVAGKVYTVGLLGDKFLLRGVSLTVATDVKNIKAEDIISTDYYSLTGAKISAPLKGINIVRYTLIDGSVVSEKVIIE